MAKMTAAHFRREIDTLAAELALLGQQRILDELPECERSIIAMSREGLSRGGISRRLRMTDAGVEWRMRRTIRRLDVLRRLPDWSEDEFRNRLNEAGVPADAADILSAWWKTSSQSRAAEESNVERCRARRVIVKTCTYLKGAAGADPKFKDLSDACALLSREGRNIRDGWLEPMSRGVRCLPKAPTRASAEEASHERREQNRRP